MIVIEAKFHPIFRSYSILFKTQNKSLKHHQKISEFKNDYYYLVRFKTYNIFVTVPKAWKGIRNNVRITENISDSSLSILFGKESGISSLDSILASQNMSVIFIAFNITLKGIWHFLI